MKNLRLTILGAMLCAFSLVTFGQGKATDKTMAMPGGVAASFLKQSKQVQGQMESLLGAIPQEKFSWRPMEGVRSIAEAFMHAGGGNYILSTNLGGSAPKGFEESAYEKSLTDKGQILEALRKSFDAVNDAVRNTPESSYGKTVKFFGMDLTVLDLIFAAATHQHELLGQQISYARMNGVVPPWTAERQKKMKEQETKK
jgi:uncharacterized damage-inducible protein DinB